MLNVMMDVPHILLAADDPDFALLIQLGFPLPTLLLIDARLHYVPGLQVIHWIRKQPALGDIRTILFSSLGTETDARFDEELGPDYSLLKPFDFQELVEA